MVFNWTNITTPELLLTVPNTITGGWFWTGILFMIFLIFLVIMLTIEKNPEVAFMSASFVGLISGIFLVYMELISWTWVLFFIGGLVLSMLYVVWSSRSDNIY